MEVPGKRQDTDLEIASEDFGEEICNPCLCDEIHVPAVGFCKTCDDYLCAKCLQTHMIPRPSRNHILLDKAHMPRAASGMRKSTCTIICPDHHDKVIEFFCPAHNAVLCGVCAVLKHKSCDNIYISEVAESFKDSKEYKSLVDTLNLLNIDIKTISTDVKETLSSVIKTSQNALSQYRQFRKEINDFLDTKEEELIHATDKMIEDDRTDLQETADEMYCLGTKTCVFLKQLKSMEDEMSDLFVTSKLQKKEVHVMLNRFVRRAEKIKSIHYSFNPGQYLTNMLSFNAVIGVVSKRCQTKHGNYCFKASSLQSVPTIDLNSKTLTRQPDITVTTKKDKNPPRITGLALLSPNSLLLADNINRSVKSVDTISNTVVSRLTLPDYPWDITTIPKDQAAVSLPRTRKIQIISTKGKLSEIRALNVDGSCYGISSTMNKLLVSFYKPASLHMMNFQGKVLVTVNSGRDANELFVDPEYITVVERNSAPVIHVSDFVKNSVTKVSLGGQVLSTYTNEKWNQLEGLAAAEDGQLLVCNFKNNTVDIVSDDGNKIQTLLDHTHGISGPESVLYHAEQNILFVSSMADNTVKSFMFKD